MKDIDGKDMNVPSKTPEEIKNSLERCGQNAECSKCAYYKKHDILYTCMDSLLPDALALIEQLERERDAAVEDILRECHKCKHFEVWFNGCTPYYGCERSDVCKDNDNWEWRGVKEGNG